MEIALVLLAWIVLGVSGFVFWWTRQYDLTGPDLLLGLAVGCLVGPLTFVIGYGVHGDSRVLINRRTTNRKSGKQ